MKKPIATYFRIPILCTIIGFVGAFMLGHLGIGGADEGFAAGFKAVFLCGVLSVLEISLSFDNAVVNASILKSMSAKWRKRFLTWGILIAVFGMRLVFPLGLAAFLGHLGPIEAIKMALTNPDEYATIMDDAHVPVAAFGGSFLLLVALHHFFDPKFSDPKSDQALWIRPIEALLAKVGRIPYADIGATLLVLAALTPLTGFSFLVAGLLGVMTFVAVDFVSRFLGSEKDNLHRASVGLFIYLEVLDASFSFDGVVGAFAITTNLLLITIGLGIGAIFVRSLTVLLVFEGTLENFKYLEQGAFWAIAALSVILFVTVFIPVPQVITGAVGATFIAASLFSSWREQGRSSRAKPKAANP